jgi:hypothetical protein
MILTSVRANGSTNICLPIELCVSLSYSDAQHYSMIYYGKNATASKSAPAKNALKEYTTMREE